MVSRKGRDAVVQHALLPSDSPLEKTPHKAGVVSVALMAAVVTLLEMAAENSSPADLDRGHERGAAPSKAKRHVLDDRLRRSGETHPPPQAWGDPCPGARSIVVERAWAQRQRAVGADRGGW